MTRRRLDGADQGAEVPAVPAPGAGNVTTDDSLTRAEELLARVEAVRAELELVSQGEGGSPERAIELLGELSELAKAVEPRLRLIQSEGNRGIALSQNRAIAEARNHLDKAWYPVVRQQSDRTILPPRAPGANVPSHPCFAPDTRSRTPASH